MPTEKDPYRILVVSKFEKMAELLNETFTNDQFTPIVSVSTMGEAKRLLVSTHFDIIIINTPLEDEFGIQSAIDISMQHNVGILLLVKNDMYEQVSYKVEDSGIITLPKPTSRQSVYNAVKMLSAMQVKIRTMEKEAIDLKGKMDEIRIINRAKWILVDQLKMSEPEAHRYIEKQAMDRCVKKKEIAENIIRTYDH
ncbi:MAG: ANTAR domain-containing protein [Bacillota bacterium]|nr:ANTAR domain-containing protein [Bacillota bacterium]